ncbi:uncharacterized protein LOC121872906, partial [Homarus americanus]|uniref:uncharacterized protein LOC121872906 n=1 Tax=Homarus americanus TaxID=6706 RepID=UPI001C44E13C
MHDVDRYRGSCLIVSKPRGGRGHSRGRRLPQDTNQQQQHDSPTPSYMMEGGSALAGMPLFSFLPQRRGPGRGHQGRPHHHHQQRGHSSPPHHHHYHRYHKDNESPLARDLRHQRQDVSTAATDEGDEVERLPLARLALHTQGAPLILPSRGPQRGSPSSRSSNTATTGTDGDGSPPAASDAVSVTSDEGSTGQAENCLPRIIKPRKRRKKDRKPGGGSGVTGVAGCEGSGDDAGGTIVTLKPYMPMCYNYDASTNTTTPAPPSDARRICEGSRACGCGGCVSAHIFPTPPPSPASSSALSTMSSASSSCSSSEDEPTMAGEGEGRQLVRSFSEPQQHPTLHISSTVTNSFAGHRDLDIRIVRSVAREVPPRTRHWSVPAVANHHHQPPPRLPHSLPSHSPRLHNDQHFLSYTFNTVTTPQPPQRPWIHLGEPERT